MSRSAAVRRLIFTAHVTASVGWLGAVAAFLAIAVAALTAGAETVRGASLVLEVVAVFMLVPLSVASLLTGLAQSIVTPWGLFRHWWVVIKLAINLVATVVLLLYLQTLDELAGLAAAGGNVDALRTPSPAVHAGAALVLLLVATTLAVYKPRGLTPYGWRKRQEDRHA